MKEELKQIGLTDGEAKAYLALLKLGSSTVGPIVKKSKISYSKIYEVLSRLIKKGLISYTIKEKTKYFQAVEPNRLIDFLNNKEKEITKNKRILKNILPKLQRTKDKEILQEAEIFVGIKGLKTAYDILLKEHSKKEPMLFFYVHEREYAETANLFYEQEFHYFKKLGIKLKGISTIDYKKSKLFKTPPEFISLKFVNFPLPSTIDIYNGKILQIAWRDKPIGILTHSQEMYENYKKYFNEIWKIAKV